MELSGNVLNDGQNRYLYDADGTRVAKGRISAWSCDPAVNGFQTTNDYILGPGGEQVTEMGVNTTAGSSATTLAWQHTNVYAGSSLIATYDNDGLHFYLNDPLGTRRAQTDYAGVLEQTCSSLPFGDQLTCTGGNLQAPTEHHFTGKERDTESGNDYFGARYYASSMGRFMSPDPSQLYYADPSNPQSFNLYSYGQNNPLINIDPTGMDCIHVNVDTGKYEGFERGDCDNSTEEKANSGQYVDGTVSSITTSTGDANGVVRGYGGTNDDTGALISGTFASPLDAPLQQIPQIDPDEQRIDALVQGVATDTASMPWVCNASVILQAQIPSTPLSVGVTADRNGVSPSAKVSKTGPNGGVAVTTNGKKVGYQIVAPVTPFVNATLSTGQNQATVGVSKQYKFGPGNVSAGASLTFGYLGDSHCR